MFAWNLSLKSYILYLSWKLVTMLNQQNFKIKPNMIIYNNISSESLAGIMNLQPSPVVAFQLLSPSDSAQRPHGLRHAKLACPSLSRRVGSSVNELVMLRTHSHPLPPSPFALIFPISGSFFFQWSLFTSGDQKYWSFTQDLDLVHILIFSHHLLCHKTVKLWFSWGRLMSHDLTCPWLLNTSGLASGIFSSILPQISSSWSMNISHSPQ